MLSFFFNLILLDVCFVLTFYKKKIVFFDILCCIFAFCLHYLSVNQNILDYDMLWKQTTPES